MTILFWLSLTVLFYTYAGYPILLWIASHKKKRQSAFTSSCKPKVTMVVPAFNEEDYIEEKVLNCLALEYPEDRMEMIFIDDGSTDRTGRILTGYEQHGIRIKQNPVREGKIASMNAAVHQANGDVIIFSDASAILDTDAVDKLVSHFGDEGVGCVSGRYIFENDDTTSTCKRDDESLYWRYEAFVREKENDLGNVIGGHGALYGIRKELYSPLSSSTINDDLAIPLMAIEKKYRTVYEKSSIAREKDVSELDSEFYRRVRIMRGNCRQIRDFYKLLNPFRGMVALQFVSHKLLRVLSPVFVITLLISCILSNNPLLKTVLIAQGAFYLMALAGSLLQRGKFRMRLLSLPYYFVFIQCSAVMGIIQYFIGGSGNWNSKKSLDTNIQVPDIKALQ